MPRSLRPLQTALLFATLVATTLGPWAVADAALNGYLKIQGQKQGPIEGKPGAKVRERQDPPVHGEVDQRQQPPAKPQLAPAPMPIPKH